MVKVINVRFEFDNEEWETLSKRYRLKDVRNILYEGGLGELMQLREGHTEVDARGEQDDE